MSDWQWQIVRGLEKIGDTGMVMSPDGFERAGIVVQVEDDLRSVAVWDDSEFDDEHSFTPWPTRIEWV